MRRASVFRFLGTAASCSAAALLPTSALPYRGVFLDLVAQSTSVEQFERGISESLAQWRRDGVKSCMLRLPIEQSALAATAASYGFTFHHVPLEAEGKHVVLKCWLQDSLEDKVPPFATHQIGIAGLCVDERNRILVVKEWRDVDGGDRVPSSQWKLPGGLLDAGESFGEAVTREVFEETGVKSSFGSLLSFWHRHNLTWGKSDMYFVARLTPDTSAVTNADGEILLTPDPVEISAARWMPVDEFVQTQDHPLINAVLRRVYGIDGAHEGQHVGDEPSRFQPLVEMRETDEVQWPGREPYPTFFATSAASDLN